jgi:hypothetical protein
MTMESNKNVHLITLNRPCQEPVGSGTVGSGQAVYHVDADSAQEWRHRASSVKGLRHDSTTDVSLPGLS